MKNIRIKNISVSNWRGQNFEFSFGLKNEITGCNGCGKSTIIKAVNWALTGYTDAFSAKNSNLFDNRNEITHTTPIARVKLTIEIDGIEYAIERTAKPKFTRKKGTSVYEKASSDEYKIYIDGIEYPSNGYEEWVNKNICDLQMLKYAISGDFFIQLVDSNKMNARSLLEGLINIDCTDLIAKYPIISENKSLSVDMIEQKIKRETKDYSKRLEEVNEALSCFEYAMERANHDFPSIEEEIKTLSKKRDALYEKLSNINKRIEPLIKKRADEELRRLEKVTAYNSAKDEYEKKFKNKDKTISEISNLISGYENELENLNERLKNMVAKREVLRKERDTLKEKSLNLDCLDVCPYCNSKVPDNMREEIIEENRKNIINDYQKIVNDGKILTTEINETEKKITQCENLIVTLNKNKEAIDCENPKAFDETDEGVRLKKEIDDCLVSDFEVPDTNDIQNEIKSIEQDLFPLYGKMGDKEIYNDMAAKLDEAKEKRNVAASELCKSERNMLDVVKYKQEVMEMLSKEVNKLLSHTYIDVWSKLKDGTIVPDVVVRKLDGVSYNSANNASRLVMNIDLQRMFCHILGVNMPTFIDEALIINKRNIPTLDDVQTFLVYCSEGNLNVKTLNSI